MREISERENVSARTLKRYVLSWERDGFEGLKPKQGCCRPDSKLPADFDGVLAAAIALRRESPSRSVKDIILILELEGAIELGSVKRSTLRRHLQAKGYSSSQMSMYSKKGAAARRFQKERRGQLWQSDVKFGPHAALAPGGKRAQTYLCVFIDDATRFIVAARFYPDQTVESLEDCFRRAVQSHGAPDACYVDNGPQYRSEWFARACAKIGTRLLKAKPYHPEGKGKIERFNRETNKLLSELALAKPETIDECNEFLNIWVAEYYHRNPHSGIDGVSPLAKFGADKKPLRFVSAETLKDAFLHTDTRKADKIGCVSFGGDLYEAGLAYVGRRVQIRFDPTWTDEIEVLREGADPLVCKKLAISENCGGKRGLPEWMSQTPPENSRMLDVLKAKHAERKDEGAIATSFAEFWEGGGNV
jgi:transposase InsO family protein